MLSQLTVAEVQPIDEYTAGVYPDCGGGNHLAFLVAGLTWLCGAPRDSHSERSQCELK